MAIARTTLSSKIVHQDKEHFARLCVDAVLRLNGSTDLDAIHIIKKAGGSLKDSQLSDGFVLEKRFGVGQPKRLVKPKILLANTAMDADRNKIFGGKMINIVSLFVYYFKFSFVCYFNFSFIFYFNFSQQFKILLSSCSH